MNKKELFKESFKESFKGILATEKSEYDLRRKIKKWFTYILSSLVHLYTLILGIITQLRRIDYEEGAVYVMFGVIVLSIFLGGGKVDGSHSFRGARFKSYRYSSYLIGCYIIYGLGFCLGLLYKWLN